MSVGLLVQNCLDGALLYPYWWRFWCVQGLIYVAASRNRFPAGPFTPKNRFVVVGWSCSVFLSLFVVKYVYRAGRSWKCLGGMWACVQHRHVEKLDRGRVVYSTTKLGGLRIYYRRSVSCSYCSFSCSLCPGAANVAW
ncbi:hypothetical protein B0T19DRAFT_417660 [Cercophora scortea]|uniref:Transmembrane protein n=1 Tax=Cercophora scortea TaxID=314031 RepID=A0AAE0IZ90_9PEZI|nr:hypothetical protein B0T19DRAFT_417660 [Cercophora scortea]